MRQIFAHLRKSRIINIVTAEGKQACDVTWREIQTVIKTEHAQQRNDFAYPNSCTHVIRRNNERFNLHQQLKLIKLERRVLKTERYY